MPISDSLESTAARPASMNTDALTVTSRDLNQLIAADRYLRSLTPAASPLGGVSFVLLSPPGGGP